MANLKKLVYIFIPVLAILLMSHNTFAVLPTFDMSNYETIYYNTGRRNCLLNDNTLLSSRFWCDLNKTQNGIKRFYSTDTFQLKRNDIIEIELLVISNQQFAFAYSTTIQNLNGYNYASLMDIQKMDNSYYHSFYEESLIPDGYYLNDIYKFYFQQRVDQTSSIGIGDNDNLTVFGLTLQDIDNYTVKYQMRSITVYRASSEDKANKEQEEATQDAADNASSAGSSSEASAEAATSSLISVIGGFVNVLTTAQPTNCKINANLNHIDMGQLDLCANPVPSYIQIIGSIILICAAIPLAIVLFNRFIGLFRSFQG